MADESTQHTGNEGPEPATDTTPASQSSGSSSVRSASAMEREKARLLESESTKVRKARLALSLIHI